VDVFHTSVQDPVMCAVEVTINTVYATTKLKTRNTEKPKTKNTIKKSKTFKKKMSTDTSR
jgi:hypothetical protein